MKSQSESDTREKIKDLKSGMRKQLESLDKRFKDFSDITFEAAESTQSYVEASLKELSIAEPEAE